jgi:hypothetical protein
MRYQDEVAAVAEAYRNARELMGNEATAFELSDPVSHFPDPIGSNE